jgi:hypothetical protein
MAQEVEAQICCAKFGKELSEGLITVDENDAQYFAIRKVIILPDNVEQEKVRINNCPFCGNKLARRT